MTLDFELHWYDIFLVLWFLIVLFVSTIKNYKRMLVANVTGALIFTLYALIKDEHVAAAMTAIAAGSGIVQLLIPTSNERKYVIIRNTLAVFAAAMACLLFYQKPADILPCISTFMLRISEAQQSAKLLKMAIIAGAVIWAVFAYMAGIYLMIAMEIVIVAVFVYNLLKKDQQSRATPD